MEEEEGDEVVEEVEDDTKEEDEAGEEGAMPNALNRSAFFIAALSPKEEQEAPGAEEGYCGAGGGGVLFTQPLL